MTIRICSNALDDGAPIPEKYSPDWLNFSPPLRFENIPADARELVLIVEDPDASTPDPWVHWLMYKIPGDVDHLPEGVVSAPHPEEPAGALQGRNTAGCVGYDGPAPPPGHGVHHYHFKVYAVDAELDLPTHADRHAVLEAMRGHVLDEGELVGTYQR